MINGDIDLTEHRDFKLDKQVIEDRLLPSITQVPWKDNSLDIQTTETPSRTQLSDIYRTLRRLVLVIDSNYGYYSETDDTLRRLANQVGTYYYQEDWSTLSSIDGYISSPAIRRYYRVVYDNMDYEVSDDIIDDDDIGEITEEDFINSVSKSKRTQSDDIIEEIFRSKPKFSVKDKYIKNFYGKKETYIANEYIHHKPPIEEIYMSYMAVNNAVDSICDYWDIYGQSYDDIDDGKPEIPWLDKLSKNNYDDYMDMLHNKEEKDYSHYLTSTWFVENRV